MSLAVPLVTGNTATYFAECEGSIFPYPNGLQDHTPYTFDMFQTSAIVVFNPGMTPPDLYPLTQWAPPGCTVLGRPMGQDIGYAAPNYYYPISRSGVFQAPADGTYTFVVYMWGGSAWAGTGNATLVYPGTTSLTVLVQ
jgi:hypothetical protein